LPYTYPKMLFEVIEIDIVFSPCKQCIKLKKIGIDYNHMSNKMKNEKNTTLPE